jgi:hypothetical protein
VAAYLSAVFQSTVLCRPTVVWSVSDAVVLAAVAFVLEVVGFGE